LLADTDVLIDFLRGNETAVELIRENSENILVSPITITELYAGARNEKERSDLDSFLALFQSIPIDGEIAKSAGNLKREFFKSHNLGMADCLIAASAIASNAKLKTLNIKHFPMFKNLEAAYTKN
ncbi:MAG: type II toxin-antitoxin system VapC family toxin, partial [Bacteroidota bacterium]